PSWSHAHSAFMVAVFVTYWHHTRERRTLLQWAILGAIGGLMLDVYYANAMLLVLIVAEGVVVVYGAVIQRRLGDLRCLAGGYMLFALALVVAFLPTLVTKRIVYGSAIEMGYIPVSLWQWKSPVFLKVLLSSNHGLFSWTPLLLLSGIGIFVFARKFS